MAVVFTLELPGVTAEQLDRTNQILLDELGAPPAGLILHVESPSAAGMTVVDVWESQEQFESFAQSTLMPALTSTGIAMNEPPQFRPVHSMMGSGLDPTDYDAVARTFYDAFTRNDPNVTDLFTEDFVDHEEFPGIPPNRDGVRQWLALMHGAFSDLRMTLEEAVGHSGTGAARIRMTGRHTGEFLGMPATGRDVDIQGIDMVKLEPDGRCSEHWGITDQVGLMTQIGAIPAQPEAPAQRTEQQA